MKLVVFFQDNLNFYLSDLVSLSDKIKDCPIVDEVYVEFDPFELKTFVDKEDSVSDY